MRFLAPDHGTRRIKDGISRDLIARLDEANIQIASGTYAIVQLRPIQIGSLPQQKAQRPHWTSTSRPFSWNIRPVPPHFSELEVTLKAVAEVGDAKTVATD